MKIYGDSYRLCEVSDDVHLETREKLESRMRRSVYEELLDYIAIPLLIDFNLITELTLLQLGVSRRILDES